MGSIVGSILGSKVVGVHVGIVWLVEDPTVITGGMNDGVADCNMGMLEVNTEENGAFVMRVIKGFDDSRSNDCRVGTDVGLTKFPRVDGADGSIVGVDEI